MRQILMAYWVTAFQAFVGTLGQVLIATLCAYSLSRRYFKYKKAVTWFLFFTMIFSGGLVPSYILITQYLNLGNSIWVYIFPTLVSVWFVIVIRTFFQGLPDSISEAAKLDGASELRIFAQIMLPLSKPVLATVAVLILLERWNTWFTTFLYIQDPDLFTLQFLLQRIMLDAQAAQNMIDNVPPWLAGMYDIRMPLESLRYAMAVVAAGPMLFVFPFFQRFFSKGLVVGAVKG
jgi:putative aldouronate transport system permease protein